MVFHDPDLSLRIILPRKVLHHNTTKRRKSPCTQNISSLVTVYYFYFCPILTYGANDADGATVKQEELHQSLRNFAIEVAPSHVAIPLHLHIGVIACS